MTNAFVCFPLAPRDSAVLTRSRSSLPSTWRLCALSTHCHATNGRFAWHRFGEIGDVYIPRARGSSESRGFAFVRFMEERDAEDAIKGMEGQEFQGRELRVQFARQRRPDNPREFYGNSGGGRGGRDDGYDRGRGGRSSRYGDDRSSRYRSRSPDRRDRDRDHGRGRDRSRDRQPRSRSRSPPPRD